MKPSSPGPDYRVQVRVDGRPTPLKPFIHDIIGGGIMGMIQGLKGIDAVDPDVIEIRIERRDLSTDDDA